MKRVFDVVASLFLLVALSPLIAIVALLVRVKIGYPVFFKQLRPGLNEVPFYLLKFRTMTNDKDNAGQLLPDEERITRFGRFLRKYSFDELPQLVNVLKGELSLVGPRPLLMEYLPLYSAEQARRHYVKPGITGWAQINGRNAISWEEKFALDVWYVDHQTFWLDMRILLLTLRKVWLSEGVSQQGHATVDRFKSEEIRVKEGRG